MADGRRSKDVDDGGSGSESGSSGGGRDDEGLEGEDLERALWLGAQRVRDADEAAGADGARGVVQTPRPARLLLLRAGAAPRPARLLFLRAGAQACAGASRGVVETAEDGDRDPEHKRHKALVSGDSCEIPKGFNDAVVDDVSKSHGKNYEEVETKMDLCIDLLHLRDLCRAWATCKLWHSVSKHGDLWKHLKLENTTISQENFVAICQRYQNITELNMCGVVNADLLVLEAIVFLRCLRTLTMGKDAPG